MIELPEAVVLSQQVADHLSGKEIRDVMVLQSPHKFAWFYGEPEEYPDLLRKRVVSGAEAQGGMVQIHLGTRSLLFYDGPSLRYGTNESAVPKKHQLLITFSDSSFLCASIQMYGGIACFDGDEWETQYHRVAREKPSPLTDAFSKEYFQSLCDIPKFSKMSAKAFLATEQRVPGLGNGTLQDILFYAGIHPKRKMGTLTDSGLTRLYGAVRDTLKQMADGGGRDTERDLFGDPGGYETVLSRNTVGTPCPKCGATREKASYGGGSVYFCLTCQPLG